MAYNQHLANRIREELVNLEGIEEKEMFGGLVFMLNGKMCVGVVKDEMMCRIDPALFEEALEITGCREMDFTTHAMKGWVMVEDNVLRNKNDINYWIALAVDYNQYAKASKKK